MTFVIAGDDGLENADLASEFAGAAAAIARHACGAGGGAISTGKHRWQLDDLEAHTPNIASIAKSSAESRL